MGNSLPLGSIPIFDLVLVLRLWGCGHRSCDVHKSTGGRAQGAQIERANAVSAVVDLKDTVLVARPQCYRLFAECLADANGSVLETNCTFAINFANNVSGPILDRRQILTERTW